MGKRGGEFVIRLQLYTHTHTHQDLSYFSSLLYSPKGATLILCNLLPFYPPPNRWPSICGQVFCGKLKPVSVVVAHPGSIHFCNSGDSRPHSVFFFLSGIRKSEKDWIRGARRFPSSKTNTILRERGSCRHWLSISGCVRSSLGTRK